jgi:hypothetical protein
MRVTVLKRSAIAIASLVAFIPSMAGAQPSEIAQYNVMTCGAFLDAQTDAGTRVAVGNFTRGFLSAHNAYNQKRQINRDLPDSTVIAFTVKYCTQHPLLDVSTAPWQLIRELGGVAVR